MPEQKFSYYQLPRRRSKGDYNEARKVIIDFVSSHSDVLAIYEYGTVTQPGISDLDMLVVIRSKPMNENLSERLTIRNIPERLATIIDNSTIKPLIKKDFRNINLLGRIKVKRLYGEEITFNNIPSSQTHLFNIATVMDWLPERILSIMEYKRATKIPVVTMLGLLGSYLYSAKRAEQILGGRIKEIVQFERKIKDLRRNWFREDSLLRLKKLRSLIDSGITSGMKALEELSFYLILNKYYMPSENVRGSFFYINKEKGFLFSEDIRDINTERYRLLSAESGTFLSIPSIWLNHLCFYSRKNGMISKRLRSNIVIKGKTKRFKINQEMSCVLTKGINLCNRMAIFYEKYQIPESKWYRFGHIKHIKKETG